MKALMAVVLASALPASAAAQESAAFLKLGAGARALGMGGAYTAIADDMSAVAWNPAGLAALAQRELGLMHAELPAYTRYDFVGFAQPMKAGTLGVAARHLSQASIDGRDASGKPTGGFSAADTAVDFAYGLRLSESLRVGGALRFIKSSIAEASAQSYAIDVGGMRRLSRFGPGVPEVGVTFQNVGPGMRFLAERSPLPLTLAAGLGYRLPAGLTLALDYRRRPYAKTSELCVGTEYAVLAGFALRAGYASGGGLSQGPFSELKGLAGGFGCRLRGYSLDYSITPFGELGNAHRFSVGARF